MITEVIPQKLEIKTEEIPLTTTKIEFVEPLMELQSIGNLPEGTVIVNKDPLYRILYALVTGRADSYAGQAAIKYIGLLFDETVYQNTIVKWEEIKKYMSETHP